MIKKDRIAVIGGGSWGTALVKLLQNNVENIGWWIRSQETINYIKEKKRNPQYLSYVEHATEKIDFSNDL